MQSSEPITDPPAVALQVLHLSEEIRTVLGGMPGVSVNTRSVGKKERKVVDIHLTAEAATDPAWVSALLFPPSGRPTTTVTGFSKWKQGMEDGKVYAWCPATESGLQRLLTAMTATGLRAVPELVRTCRDGDAAMLLINFSAKLKENAEVDACAQLRTQGLHVTASWEPCLLELSEIPSKLVYSQAAHCVPKGTTCHQAGDTLSTLNTNPQVGPQAPAACPLVPGNSFDPMPAASGCTLTPLLTKTGLRWQVPVVPINQLLALADWLSTHRIEFVDVQPADRRAKPAKPTRAKNAHVRTLQAAVGAGSWESCGLHMDAKLPKGIRQQVCACCAGLHSKHVCPHGALQWLTAACDPSAGAHIQATAYTQQQQRLAQCQRIQQSPETATMASKLKELWANKPATPAMVAPAPRKHSAEGPTDPGQHRDGVQQAPPTPGSQRPATPQPAQRETPPPTLHPTMTSPARHGPARPQPGAAPTQATPTAPLSSPASVVDTQASIVALPQQSPAPPHPPTTEGQARRTAANTNQDHATGQREARAGTQDSTATTHAAPGGGSSNADEATYSDTDGQPPSPSPTHTRAARVHHPTSPPLRAPPPAQVPPPPTPGPGKRSARDWSPGDQAQSQQRHDHR